MHTHRYHLIIDLQDIPPDILVNSGSLNEFLSRLPSLIDMSILHGPVIKSGIPANPGLTGFVIIDYSHISIHTFSDYNEALVDIFSCKPYDKEVALQAVVEYFQISLDQTRVHTVFWE